MFLFQYAHHLTAAPFLTFTKQSNRIHEAAKMIFSDINLQHEDTDYTRVVFYFKFASKLFGSTTLSMLITEGFPRPAYAIESLQITSSWGPGFGEKEMPGGQIDRSLPRVPLRVAGMQDVLGCWVPRPSSSSPAACPRPPLPPPAAAGRSDASHPYL